MCVQFLLWNLRFINFRKFQWKAITFQTIFTANEYVDEYLYIFFISVSHFPLPLVVHLSIYLSPTIYLSSIYVCDIYSQKLYLFLFIYHFIYFHLKFYKHYSMSTQIHIYRYLCFKAPYWYTKFQLNIYLLLYI